MKFYIASRFGNLDEVRKTYKVLKQQGHTISLDWTIHESVKPYGQNEEKAARYSVEDVEGVRRSQVFVLLSDEAGTGMYVEFGIALQSFLEKGSPLVYVIGAYTDRCSFFFHPAVRRVKTIEEVLGEVRDGKRTT